MANLFRQKNTDKKTGELRESKKWYGQYTDANGVKRRVALSENKTAAQVMLGELVRRVEREKAGLSEPTDVHQTIPLADHLAAYKSTFAEKGHTAKQAHNVIDRCEKVFAGCRFRFLSDLSAERAQTWLAGRRGPRESGKLGPQTLNHYVSSLKSFGRWCEKTGRTARNPFATLVKLNTQVDVRHQRRELSAYEFRLLIEATEAGRSLMNLTGVDRAILYRVAGITGLRASECASLTPASFDLAISPPTVTVEAAYSKHRRKDVVPLNA